MHMPELDSLSGFQATSLSITEFAGFRGQQPPACGPNPIHCQFYYGLKEKAIVSHSSTLAWKIPWTEEPGRLQSMRSLRVRHHWVLHFHFSLSCIGEGNGNPLQYSCLENPRDGGAWWAAISGVAQSRTRLKQLSSSSSSKLRKDFFSLLNGSGERNGMKTIS